MIRFETNGPLAIIRLNRPDKLNAFIAEMALALQSALNDCHYNKNIRCVYLTGEGKAFSAGQDLSEVSGPGNPGFGHILSMHYNPIIKKIYELEKPVLAAVNGVAAGAGANIALCCDIVVAAKSATFIQAFSKIGLIPDSGGTYFLPRLVGWQKASALMMLGDKIPAPEAERMGMIYKYFEDDVFESESMKIAQTLANMPTAGLALTKKALQWSLSYNLDDQLANEDKLQQQAGRTKDYQEGVQAFLEKRSPVFKGE